MVSISSVAAKTLISVLSILAAFTVAPAGNGQWKFPIPSPPPPSDSLTFETVLHRIAQSNRQLMAVDERKGGLAGMIEQSGAWPNPAVEFNVEEFGGSLPGFSESELTFSLSQEFELWGKRKARRQAAEVEAEAVRLEADMAAFDIYTDASLRFYELLYAQKHLWLIQKAHELILNMVDLARLRVEKGAALISELHMAELEAVRNTVELNKAEMELNNAKRNLASLWNGTSDEIKAVSDSTRPPELPELAYLLGLVDGSRDIMTRDVQRETIRAMIQSARMETRPSIELSAGLKHLSMDNHNAFMVGVALPLPLFNRNRGQLNYLHSQAGAVEHEKEQALTRTEMEIINLHEQARQLQSRLDNLHQELIPKAEETFAALDEAYQKGKLPYLTMLEGERMLLELQRDRNETLLEYQCQIVALEKILGVTLHKFFDMNGER